MSRYLGITFCGLVAVLCLGSSPALAEEDWETKAGVQVAFGATRYDGLRFDVPLSQDGTTVAEQEFTLAPLIGVWGMLPLEQARTFDAGLEGGVLFGWRSASTTAYGGGGTIAVHVDTSLMLFDFSMGPYINTKLGTNVRVYAGAGPLLMFVDCGNDTDEVVNEGDPEHDDYTTSSAFGVGGYVRTGIEYRFADKTWLGLGVRAFSSELDFDDVDDEITVKGVQYMLTFTAGL